MSARGGVLVAVEADRRLADALDQRENVLPLLLAHGVAEQPAEQADVVAQRGVFVVRGGPGAGQGCVVHGQITLDAVPARSKRPTAALHNPCRNFKCR